MPIANHQIQNPRAANKMAKLSVGEFNHSSNSNTFIANNDEMVMDTSEIPNEALAKGGPKGNAANELAKNNRITANTYSNANNSRNLKDPGSTLNKFSSNNYSSHLRVNNSHDSTANNHSANFDTYKDPRNQNEIYKSNCTFFGTP